MIMLVKFVWLAFDGFSFHFFFIDLMYFKTHNKILCQCLFVDGLQNSVTLTIFSHFIKKKKESLNLNMLIYLKTVSNYITECKN